MAFRTAFALSALLLAGAAQAAPIYYDFVGTVSWSNNPDHAVGSTVRYVFLVDRDLAGYRYHPSGMVNYVDSPGYDFFYVDYVGGDASAPNSALYPYDWNVGGNQVYSGTGIAWLNGSNGYGSSVSVRGDSFLETWNAGTVLSGSDYNGSYSVSSTLHLVGTNTSNPLAVPEPGTMALMGLGLAAMGFAARRRKS